MKTWSTVLLGVAILFAAQFAHTGPDKAAGDRRGSFEGVAASDNTIWVVDTRSGRVRKCTQEFADQTPRCSKLSN
jgi:hypothetical protein